jgi:DNA-binding NarL/FixJ family response regulator
MIQVLLADHQQLVRAGFRMILSSEPDIEVVGEAADGVEAVDCARRLRPDLVLMDVRMPRLNGIEATRQLPMLPDPPRVLVVTWTSTCTRRSASVPAGSCSRTPPRISWWPPSAPS